MFAYLVSGLRVASDLALPGLIEGDAHADPDVVIRAGAVAEALDAPSSRGPNWQLAGDRFLIAVPRIVRMLLTGGREIVYEPLAGLAPEQTAIFVSGTGFGILLHQRERIVLHASAVRVGDKAVLFCGPSGAGKSTLAAALGERGYPLIADDFCAIDLGTPAPRVFPDGRLLKLWANAIERLALAARRAAPVRTQIRKYYVEPRAASAESLPIMAVYVLREARPPLVPGIVRANIVDGALAVRGNAYRPNLVARTGQRELYFQAAAILAQRAGVFTFTRHLNFAELPAGIDRLEAEWRDDGQVEAAA